MTFTSDLGRLFSVFVLVSGVVLLLVVLLFAFIRFFYAPWFEAQARLRGPRRIRPSVREHVIISRHDEIAVWLIERLRPEGIPYYAIEPNPAVAAQMLGHGISIISGDIDNRATYAGGFKGMDIAGFSAHNTPLAGRIVRETRLRETTGLNIVGIWERGRLRPAFLISRSPIKRCRPVRGRRPRCSAGEDTRGIWHRFANRAARGRGQLQWRVRDDPAGVDATGARRGVDHAG